MMMKMRVNVLLGVFLLGELALGQVTTGTISGTIRDTTGAVVPSATVTATNIETGIARTVASNSQGRYQLPNLPVGSYQLQAEMTGFQTALRSGIELTVGREAVVNLGLEVGAVSERVEVTGEAPLVNTTNSTVSALVDEKTIADLPLNGRSFVQLATLQPGVNSMNTNADEASLSISGGRSTQNNFLLDGITMNNEQNKTPVSQSGQSLGVEAIREFTVLTSNYSAEFGRGGGGIINAITKSGTNQLHGSVFEFLRNDNFDARNFFDDEKPEFKRNQFGFSLGGPVIRNRTFFFGTYEGLRQRLGLSSSLRSFGPLNRQGFAPPPTPGPLVNVGVNSAVKPYLDLWPNPNRPNLPNYVEDGTALFAFTDNQPTREDFFQVRADHNIGSNDSFFLRYTQSYSAKDRLLSFPGSNTEILRARNHYATMEESKILSPTVLNVFRAGFNRNTPSNDIVSPDVPAALSFVPNEPFGGITVTGVDPFGSGSTSAKHETQNSFQLLDTVSLLKGRHSLKFGFHLERIQDNLVDFTRARGTYDFNTIGLFLQNLPARFEVVPPGDDRARGIRETLISWYVQEDLQWSERFSINLGLRHEFFTTPTEVNGKVPNIRDIFLADPAHVGDPFIENPSYKNFAPRVGFAWSPFGDGKTSLRGGVGLFYDPILAYQIDNTFLDMPPFSRRARINTPQFPNGLSSVGTAQFLFLPKTTEFSPASSYTVRGNLTVEREILPETIVSLGYVAARGVHLSHLRDMNEPLPTSIINGMEFRQTGAPRRNRAYSEVRQSAFDSDSIYHSLQLNLRKRFSQGLQYQAAYTFSKLIDTASSGGAKREFTQSTSIATSPDDSKFDRGLSNFDVRHVLVSNFTYELPVGNGRRVLSSLSGVGEMILGGWAVNGIITLSSGTPVTVRAGFDRDNNDELDADRPDLLPGKSNNPVLGQPDNYFDEKNFTLAPAGFRGNTGRNTIIGPGLANVDFSLFKKFSMTERASVQFRFETFNLLNRANFQPPSFPALFDRTLRALPNPGRITGTVTSARQLQLGLRLSW